MKYKELKRKFEQASDELTKNNNAIMIIERENCPPLVSICGNQDRTTALYVKALVIVLEAKGYNEEQIEGHLIGQFIKFIIIALAEEKKEGRLS